MLGSKQNGSQGRYIFINKDEKNEIFVLMKWGNLNNFKKFSQSVDPKKAKESGGVLYEPKVWFFEDAEEVSK